jgi:hypothetical protein
MRPTYSGKRFTWSGVKGVAELSDFDEPLSLIPSFVVQSHQTGVSLVFTREVGCDKVSREGELESITFLSQPTYISGVLKVIRIELIND